MNRRTIAKAQPAELKVVGSYCINNLTKKEQRNHLTRTEIISCKRKQVLHITRTVTRNECIQNLLFKIGSTDA